MLRSPTRYTLGSMVSHFQKLFDVPSLSGVYPRMNKVYSQLGEMNNAMRNLRDVLDLGNLLALSHRRINSSWSLMCGVLCQTAELLPLRW